MLKLVAMNYSQNTHIYPLLLKLINLISTITHVGAYSSSFKNIESDLNLDLLILLTCKASM